MLSLAPDSLVADRFRLVHELGRGGMGAVWRAHHVRLGVPCAVKFILGDAAANPELRSRFEMEAQAAAQIKSPHVVQILDHGVFQETPYIAMELLEGEDLEKRLQKRGRLEIREVAAIMIQVARALGKAHAAGLIHRDLKPANIFLCHDEDGTLVKILDFGIAKQTQAGFAGAQTKSGVLLGTPYYMSPEQARGTAPVDHRSDLWALAVIVYECITGHLPFESPAIGDLLVKIMFQPLPVPSKVASVPRGFDAFWARAACREPEGRFQTARAMADALAKLAGLPSSSEAQRGNDDIPSPPRDAAYARTELSGAGPGQSSGASGTRGSRVWLVPVAVVLCLLAASAAFFAVRGPGAEATSATADPAGSGVVPPGSPTPVVIPGTSVAAPQDSPPASPTATLTAPPAASPTAPAPGSGKMPVSKPTARPVTTVPKHHDDGI